MGIRPTLTIWLTLDFFVSEFPAIEIRRHQTGVIAMQDTRPEVTVIAFGGMPEQTGKLAIAYRAGGTEMCLVDTSYSQPNEPPLRNVPRAFVTFSKS